MENHADNKLRCREGDLALIIRDEPGCEANLGRAVTVHGPIRYSLERGPTWLVEPTMLEPWAVRNFGGQEGGWIGVVTLDHFHFIEHPDAWLLPLSPEEEFEPLAMSVEEKLRLFWGGELKQTNWRR